jgi:hypothetical protein
VRRLTALFLFLIVACLLSGCQVRSSVVVDVHSNGTGTISVKAVLDKQAALALPDIEQQLQTSDLVKAGWSVKDPTESDDGSKTILVEHGFGSPEEATLLLRSLSGNGPPFVGFQLTQTHSLTHVESSLTGGIDLRQGINSYGDLGLTQSVGSRLGFDPTELEKSLGVDWASTFPLEVVVRLPGRYVQSEGTSNIQNDRRAKYGEITEIHVQASGANTRPMMFFALSVTAFVASILVLVFWKSGKYRPRHKKNGVRARDLLKQQGT